MSELQDALDKWETWLASAHGVDFDHDTMFAILTVNEAARRVAKGKSVEWCETHQEPLQDSTSVHIVEDDCQMVPKLLIDPPEETDA